MAKRVGGPLPARLDLFDRPSGQFVELGIEFGIAHRLAGAVEILAHLAQDIRVARLFEIGQHDALGIGIRLVPALAEPLGNPEPEQLVAARRRLKAQVRAAGVQPSPRVVLA
jgi:hypothetical protein